MNRRNFIKNSVVCGAYIAVSESITTSALGPQSLHAAAAVQWWKKQQRMLQTNLREIDVTMDLDQYVQSVKDSGANVVLVNVGGIVANYPTELPYHFRNPRLKNDFTGEVVRRMHDAGVYVIGRFDFSKINEKIAAKHPDWLYVSAKGKNVNYNGQVHSCFNGEYQQERSINILDEVLDRYPLDGVFFNMPGYQDRDYSGNYHGICRSAACRRAYQERYQMELPKTHKDKKIKKYKQFKNKTKQELFLKIHSFLKKKKPGLAICTYTATGVDIRRNESNKRLGRWSYFDTFKSKNALSSHPDVMLSNSAVHFLQYTYRHSSVSPWLTQRRIVQAMFAGTWLDFYCIGPFHRQEDRLNIEVVRDVFRFHKRNEKWLAKAKTIARVSIMASQKSNDKESEGLVRILSEHHIPYDIVSWKTELKSYDLLILYSVKTLENKDKHKLNQFVKNGGKLLISGNIPDGLEACGLKAK